MGKNDAFVQDKKKIPFSFAESYVMPDDWTGEENGELEYSEDESVLRGCRTLAFGLIRAKVDKE